MRNLGPAFRNFLDAENDPGNVNCTFQKNNADAKRFIDSRHYDMDPRSIVYVKAGFNEPTQLLPVTTSSWTRDPDTLAEGEYAYDNLSSADFVVVDFPFHEFVQHISGKSSYDIISGIKEFYDALDRGEMEDGTPVQNADKIRYEYGKILAVRMREEYNVPRETVASLFLCPRTRYQVGERLEVFPPIRMKRLRFHGREGIGREARSALGPSLDEINFSTRFHLRLNPRSESHHIFFKQEIVDPRSPSMQIDLSEIFFGQYVSP